MSQKEEKVRALFFSAAKQTLLLELHEEYKEVITKKGNTAAINKSRDMAWRNITDRLNAQVMQVYHSCFMLHVYYSMLFCKALSIASV